MTRWIAISIVLATTHLAAADTASDLIKQGLDQYKAGQYEDARRSLTKAYELDGKPETLFALAQAERLAGDCKAAIPHYRKVIELVPDFNVAKLVQQNLSLCGATEPAPTDDPDAKSDPVAAPPPTTIVRTEVRPTDKLAVMLFGIGALSIGSAGGLYLAASANRDAADKARTLGDHDELFDRSKMQTTASAIAAGVGVALITVAVVRWARGDAPGDEPSTDGVAVVPLSGGGAISFSSSW